MFSGLPYGLHDYAMLRNERWIEYEKKIEDEIRALDMETYWGKRAVSDYASRHLILLVFIRDENIVTVAQLRYHQVLCFC